MRLVLILTKKRNVDGDDAIYRIYIKKCQKNNKPKNDIQVMEWKWATRIQSIRSLHLSTLR